MQTRLQPPYFLSPSTFFLSRSAFLGGGDLLREEDDDLLLLPLELLLERLRRLAGERDLLQNRRIKAGARPLKLRPQVKGKGKGGMNPELSTLQPFHLLEERDE